MTRGPAAPPVPAPNVIGMTERFVPRRQDPARDPLAWLDGSAPRATWWQIPASAPVDSGDVGSTSPGVIPRIPDFAPAVVEDAPANEAPPLPIVHHAAWEELSHHLRDGAVTDLFVNGAQGLFVDRGHGAEPVPGWSLHEDDVRDLAVALIGAGGRHIDDASPCVDVRVGGHLRVHAVLPPVSGGGTALSIRVGRRTRADLGALQAAGMFDAAGRARLEEIVRRRENVLVSGAAGAGKTTLLAALLGTASARERIVTIEDVAELSFAHPHHVRLEARQPNLEGAGGIGLARLVREALRMRPDRLVVGECRGEEVRELLSALNTGHDGGAGTVHANGLADVAARLEALGALAGMSDQALARQVASALHWILHVERDAAGTRRLQSIGRPRVGPDGRLEIEETPWSLP